MSTDTVRKASIKDDRGGSHEYMQVLFGGLEGWELGMKLLDVLGSSLDLAKGPSSVITGLVAGIARAGGTAMLMQLLSNVTRDGKLLDNEATVTIVFSGNYGEMTRVLAWVITENFSGFSGAALDLAGQAVVSLTKPANASTLSTLMPLLDGLFGHSSKLASEAGEKSAATGPSPTSSTPKNTSG
jgi:hypothetical protein